MFDHDSRKSTESTELDIVGVKSLVCFVNVLLSDGVSNSYVVSQASGIEVVVCFNGR